MRKDILKIMAASLAMMAAVGCTNQKKTDEQPPLVRLCSVQTVASSRANTYPGKTVAANSSHVAFKVAGTIEAVPVRVGDHVRAGQVLARMDSRDYQVQLNATRAEYESTKAECERIIALYQDQSTSENNYDKARYGLEQITQKLRHAEDQLQDCVIRAPYDGYVQAVLHEAHETVGAGMPVVSLFTSRGLEVVINIPAVEFQRQESFAGFKASFGVKEGREYDMKLLSVAQKANANQLYEMHLLLEDPEGTITPGMTTMVSVAYKDEGQLPMELPGSAVFADGPDDVSCVYLYDEADGTIHKTPVTMTYVGVNGTVQIIQGLTPGQRVVSSGVHQLTDGQRVRPVQEPTRTNVGGLL